jgi:hypothetical protein
MAMDKEFLRILNVKDPYTRGRISFFLKNELSPEREKEEINRIFPGWEKAQPASIFINVNFLKPWVDDPREIQAVVYLLVTSTVSVDKSDLKGSAYLRAEVFGVESSPLLKYLSSTKYFLFNNLSWEKIIKEEPVRLLNFFEKEVKILKEIIKDAKKIAPRLSRLLYLLGVEEERREKERKLSLLPTEIRIIYELYVKKEYERKAPEIDKKIEELLYEHWKNEQTAIDVFLKKEFQEELLKIFNK